MNRAVDGGVLRGFREGLLTSTSVLANAPDAARAMREWRVLGEDYTADALPSIPNRRRLGDPSQTFDLGVHLNLTQGRPLDGSRYPVELLDSEGRFPGVFALFARLRRFGGKFHTPIREELERQIQFVLDHGTRPTHLNGHQYVEMMPTMADIVMNVMERFKVKVVRVADERSLFRSTLLGGRHAWKLPLALVKRAFAGRFLARIRERGIGHPDVFYGTVHAGEINLRVLRRFLASGQKHQFVEVGLHPAETTEKISPEHRADGWFDPLADWRPNELRMLVSAELPTWLESSGRRLGRLADLSATS